MSEKILKNQNGYVKLASNSGGEFWKKMPFKNRISLMVNSSGWPADKPLPDRFNTKWVEGVGQETSIIMYDYLDLEEPADKQVREWILKGDVILPKERLLDLVKQCITLKGELKEPCRIIYGGNTVGIGLSRSQFRNLTSIIQVFLKEGILKEKDFAWMANNISRWNAFGLVVMSESEKEILGGISHLLGIAAMATRNAKLGFPVFVAQGGYSLTNRNTPIEDVRMVILPNEFIRSSMVLIRNAIPQILRDAVKDNDFLENGSVDSWLSNLVKTAHENGIQWINHSMEKESKSGQQAESSEADSAEEEDTEASLPKEDRREAQRLRREKKFDILPDLLEGLTAYDAYMLASRAGGMFHKDFLGEPAVVDRLVDEAGEAKQRKEGEEKRPYLTFKSEDESSPKPVLHVVKGSLVFARRDVFGIVRDRRYNARAMLKKLGIPVDKNLPDIQVLAPHEFGQVPGFVAGQYRYPKDRLCIVMITFDKSLWELNLRERKDRIEASKGPKLWVFPSSWLKDMPSGLNWWHAGWFGTPKDPAILDFVVPNGNYDI